MSEPCDTCVETVETAEHPVFNTPLHLVHPGHGKPGVYDTRGFGICPECGAAWHSGTDNHVRYLGFP